jgi:hypothetical protein
MSFCAELLMVVRSQVPLIAASLTTSCKSRDLQSECVTIISVLLVPYANQMSMFSRLIGTSRKQADDLQMSALAAENASLSERLLESERWNSVQTKQLEIL